MMAYQSPLLFGKAPDPAIWGTGGMVGESESDPESGNSLFNQAPIVINGKTYWQAANAGTPTQIDWNQYGGGLIFDPQYGYLIPDSTYRAYGQANVEANDAGGWQGGRQALAMLASAFGGQLLSGLGEVGAGVGGIGINELAFGLPASELAGGASGVINFGGFEPTMFDDFFPEIMNAVDNAGEFAAEGASNFNMLDPNINPFSTQEISTQGMSPGVENLFPNSFSSTGGAGLLEGFGSSGYGLTNVMGAGAGGFGTGGSAAGAGGNWWDFLIPGPGDLMKLILGTNSQGGSKGIFDLFGTQGLLGTGLALAPGIAALNYAQNQGTPDLSGLQAAGLSMDPASLANEYDVNTGLGRDRLTSNLARRGIAGSSFGESDLTNFNTARDLGRQQLISQGAGTNANIQDMIVKNQLASQKLKNDLYGRALLAMSGGLTPKQNSIFGAGGF